MIEKHKRSIYKLKPYVIIKEIFKFIRCLSEDNSVFLLNHHAVFDRYDHIIETEAMFIGKVTMCAEAGEYRWAFAYHVRNHRSATVM